ncbi:MAG: hypothetical protein ACOX7H_08845 [Bacillota bacterium]|jgi:hypothetical protein
MRGIIYMPVREPGANPRPFDPSLLGVGRKIDVPIYPCYTRKMTEEEWNKYGPANKR